MVAKLKPKKSGIESDCLCLLFFGRIQLFYSLASSLIMFNPYPDSTKHWGGLLGWGEMSGAESEAPTDMD